jgi:hypothetical protein
MTDTKKDMPHATVKAYASMTLNLGNYQSAKVEAGIDLPCPIEEVPKEFERAWAEVYRQLEIKVAEIRNGGMDNG